MAIDWNSIKFFAREEWKKDPDKVADDLVYLLDEIRQDSNVPIKIHVAWDSSGHSPKSYHYTGLAVDFHFMTDKDSFPFVEQFALLSSYKLIGGLGFYPYWKNIGWHIDLRIRPKKLVWFREIDGNYIYGERQTVRKILEV